VNVAVGGSNNPRWSGDGREEPEEATNHQGVWHRGDRDDKGDLVPICHPNARYTVELHRLKNADVPSLEDPQGVKPSVILYGGRDSTTTVPVEQAFDWEQGVATKCAILESETTKATVGEAGVPVMDPGSMRDFVSIPLGRYIGNHLAFGKKAKSMPSIFSVNYFLREGGRDLTDKEDKRIWVKWAVLRARGDVDAIETPTGFIPRYEDLQKLFQRILEKEFTREHYDQLFTVRIPEWLAKIQRGVDLYQKSPGTPGVLLQLLEEQKQRLEKLRAKRGNYVKPDGLHREDWA
jgi:phosphoenolpyruvate carboxykinase (GTP)